MSTADRPESPATSRKIAPLFDHPLRDAAICRARDGTYYLTGTAASVGRDSTPDFNNNDGVWLWRSTDLRTWQALGQVWSIYGQVINDPSPFHSKSKWQTYWRTIPGVPDSPPVRGMTAPEIHQVKGTFVITYSMNGNGTGLLRSVSGEAIGPYEDLGMMTHDGGDASIFEDDDGAVYWLWGNAWIARMNDDLSGLAEQPRHMQFVPDKDPRRSLRTAGAGGAFLVKADIPGWDHKYHLVYYDYVPRMDCTACCDALISSADSPYGPWSGRRLMVPHGGQVTVFNDGRGNYYSTFSGSDEWAAFRDRPGIVPLVKHATVATVPPQPYWWGGALCKPRYPATERGHWADVEPFFDMPLRDLCILNAPDEYYYLTATELFPARLPRDQIGIRIWRSRDMANWEPMGLVWRCDDEAESRAGLDRRLKATGGSTRTFLIFDTEMHYLKGTYWLLASMVTGPQWWEREGMLILLLRSDSGRPEGPYRMHWKDQHDDRGRFWTPNLFQDDDGTCYLIGGGRGDHIARLNDDLSGIAEHLPNILPQGGYNVGEGGHIVKIGQTYFHTSAESSGFINRGGFGSEEHMQLMTYDLNYTTARSVRGPWSPTRAVPRCGNCRPFQDKRGQWWMPFMDVRDEGPWACRPGAYPVIINDDVILPLR